jgi:hypothetical protein
MESEKPLRKIVYIGDTAPAQGEYAAWIDTASKSIKVYESGQWVTKTSLSYSPSGYTGKIKQGNKDLYFENGLLLKYE